MRVLIALQLSAVALLTMAQTPAPATSDPVVVKSCTVHPRDTTVTVLQPNVSITNGVTVTLMNASDKTVSAVTVTGSYHGRVVTDTAKGTIKPGDTVKVFRQYQPSTYIDADAKCSVVHVDFTDGTSWDAPATPAPAAT